MAVSSMAFSTAYAEVASQLGLDSTDTNTATRLKRWLNLSYKDIAGFYEWSWLKDREEVEMIPDITTGTVSISADSTTVTFSSAPAVSVTDWIIQFEGSDNWYTIASHTASASTATLDTNYVETSALSAGTYILRKFRYSLSSSVEYVETCRQSITNRKVAIISAREYDLDGFPLDTAASIDMIHFWGHDSSNNWIFTPFPIPSSPLLLEFRFIKAITELSADSDTAIFPPRFDSIWLAQAKKYGYEFLNERDMYAMKAKEVDAMLTAMKRKDRVGRDQLDVIQSVDNGRCDGVVRFPGEFGDVY